MKKPKKKVAILGAGSFATATAYLTPDFDVSMWEYRKDRALLMQKERKCLHLSNVSLPKNTIVDWDIGKVIDGAEMIFIVVPSDRVEETMRNAKPYLKRTQKIIICSKGFGCNQRVLSECVSEIAPKNPVLYLSGPMLAGEIVAGKFCAATLSGPGAKKVKEELQSKKFAIRLCADMIGPQLGGALKNVFTMYLGCVDGADFGQNTQKFLFSECMQEIISIGNKLGADPDTFWGLSYLFDLMLHSRNYEFGKRIGKGEHRDDIMVEMSFVPEGLATLKNAVILAKKHNLNVPIIFSMDAIVSRRKKPEKAILDMLELLRIG